MCKVNDRKIPTTELPLPTYLLIDKLEMSEQLDGEGDKKTKLLLETSISCLHSSEERERLSQQGQRTLKFIYVKRCYYFIIKKSVQAIEYLTPINT